MVASALVAVYIVVGIVVLLLLAAIFSYNRFVSQRNLIRNAWANIDTELRRRYDLIPNLVESVKGYAAHEREVFEEVARTRATAMQATGSPAQQAQAEGPFVQALGRLFAVAENYPQLRATENFQQLQGELSNTEDRIQTSRRFYNNNVQDYNRRVQQFPSMFIARMFSFKEEEFFEIPDAIREAGVPQVSFADQGPAVTFGTSPVRGAGQPPPAPTPTPPAPPEPGSGSPPSGGGFTG
jgi:LemA protein